MHCAVNRTLKLSFSHEPALKQKPNLVYLLTFSSTVCPVKNLLASSKTSPGRPEGNPCPLKYTKPNSEKADLSSEPTAEIYGRFPQKFVRILEIIN